jgi:hypothetical protein
MKVVMSRRRHLFSFSTLFLLGAEVPEAPEV